MPKQKAPNRQPEVDTQIVVYMWASTRAKWRAYANAQGRTMAATFDRAIDKLIAEQEDVDHG